MLYMSYLGSVSGYRALLSTTFASTCCREDELRGPASLTCWTPSSSLLSRVHEDSTACRPSKVQRGMQKASATKRLEQASQLTSKVKGMKCVLMLRCLKALNLATCANYILHL